MLIPTLAIPRTATLICLESSNGYVLTAKPLLMLKQCVGADAECKRICHFQWHCSLQASVLSDATDAAEVLMAMLNAGTSP